MKIHKIITSLILCTALIITQTGCTAKENDTAEMSPVSDTQYDLLNTTCIITIYDMNSKDAQNFIDAAFSLCKDYENKLSKTIEGSDVYKINHSDTNPVAVCNATLKLIKQGIYYGDLSESNFDITVGKLSTLWNFSGDSLKVPNENDIKAAINTIDYKKIHFEEKSLNNNSSTLENISDSNNDLDSKSSNRYALEIKNDFIEGGKVWIEDPNTELDLGGIAKGFIADQVSKFLVSKGVKSATVSLGGNVVAIGSKKDGSLWNIGIEQPFSDRREIVGSVQAKNKTIVTSGIYERMFKENGILYHHILDVKTGFPAETNVESVTLIADFGKSIDCDALSTICLMLGTEKGISLIENIDGVEASFIDKDGTIVSTSGMNFIPIE